MLPKYLNDDGGGGTSTIDDTKVPRRSLLLPLTGIASHPQSYSTYLGTYIWMQDLKNKIQKGKGDF